LQDGGAIWSKLVAIQGWQQKWQQLENAPHLAGYDLARAMGYLNEKGFLASTGVGTTGFEQLDDLGNPRMATILDIVIREATPYVSYHVPKATFDDLVNGDVPCLAWTPLQADTRRWENS
jgi:hypothetical protein